MSQIGRNRAVNIAEIGGQSGDKKAFRGLLFYEILLFIVLLRY